MIGKLARVPLREVWRHEALDFTRWLEEHVDELNEALGLRLSNVEREKSAGSFSVDLVAEDEAGNAVVIENQFGRSDHDHLGKLITYLTAIGAKTAVWIVEDPRPEHISAVTWLNESSAAAFYLLKVEAVKIGNSPPAPLITKIVGPSEETRAAGQVKKNLEERHLRRHEFWLGLLEHAKGKTRLHAGISPTHENWIAASAGLSGVSFNYTVRQHDARVELYLSRGSATENSTIFDALAARREAIESAFGGPLDWQPLEGKKACRIAHLFTGGGYRDQERWAEIQAALADAMVRLEGAMKPHLAALQVQFRSRAGEPGGESWSSGQAITEVASS